MDPLQQQQLDIASRLMADPWFAEFAVFVLRPRAAMSAVMIQEAVNNSLAGIASGNGIAIEVLMPLLEREGEAGGALIFQSSVIIRVKENPGINMGAGGSRTPCEEIAIRVCVTLEGFYADGYSSPLCVARDSAAPRLDFPGLVVYDVKLKSRLGVSMPAMAATPAISGDHAGVTLACATGGAAIYYTTDGSYPWPGATANPSTGALYTGPFTCAPGAIIRACAFLAGSLASNTAWFTAA
jgi:hypothetical protein